MDAGEVARSHWRTRLVASCSISAAAMRNSFEFSLKWLCRGLQPKSSDRNSASPLDIAATARCPANVEQHPIADRAAFIRPAEFDFGHQREVNGDDLPILAFFLAKPAVY
jgi:hypothetical protein